MVYMMSCDKCINTSFKIFNRYSLIYCVKYNNIKSLS